MKFELESVLSLKHNMEDNKKRELGQANYKKMQLENEKEALENTFSRTLGDLKEEAHDKVNIIALKQSFRYSKHLKQQIIDKEMDIVKAEKEVKEKREELTEAVKQRKILENLKALRFEQHYEEEKKREQNLTDEMVSYKYTTRERGD